MKTYILLFFLGCLITVNVHLRLSGNSMLMMITKMPDGWYQHCIYYAPVHFTTKIAPVGGVCERFAQI